MNFYIRTHVKNPERLELLRRTLDSVRVAAPGPEHRIFLIDDGSTFDGARGLAASLGAVYLNVPGPHETKNGMYWSLKVDQDMGQGIHLVDDCVVSKGILDSHSWPAREDVWLWSFFACYPRNPSGGCWHYPTKDFYAAVACIFHPDLRDLYISWREKVLSGQLPEEVYQDDLMMKKFILEAGKRIYNTGWDYAQHTGIGQRSFGDNPKEESSNYQTAFFKGE